MCLTGNAGEHFSQWLFLFLCLFAGQLWSLRVSKFFLKRITCATRTCKTISDIKVNDLWSLNCELCGSINELTKSIGLKFCRTFIPSVSLFTDLAGPNLVQTLLNPPQVAWDRSFLLGGCIGFSNEKKGSCSIESFTCKPQHN